MNKGELSILIVDDDDEDILVIETLLRQGLKGVALEVDRARSFAEGLNHIEKARYDVFLFDYLLGDKSALDLFREVKARGVDTPVVFFTGNGDEAVAVEAMKLGAFDYLPKSKLSETLLRSSVRHAIELHDTQRLARLEVEQMRRMNHKLESSLKELEHRTLEDSSLDEFSNSLHACVSIDEACALIALRIPEFFPNLSGALCLIDGSRNLVEVAASWGENPPSDREFKMNECLGLRRGRPYFVRDAGTEITCPHLSGSSWKSHLCVPMIAYSEALGVMVLQSSAPAGALLEEERTGIAGSQRGFAEILSQHVALALANLRLREALQKQSVRDPLTGLFNRRYMEECLDRAVSRSVRHNLPLTVLMLDLDRFKEFNDARGHAAGDALLLNLGVFLQSHTRKEDIACRYGGEEFVLILPEMSAATAAVCAEQIRTEFKGLAAQQDYGGKTTQTLSIGIAVAPEHGLSSKALLEAADAALYRAKGEGRDRVVIGEARTPGLPTLFDQARFACNGPRKASMAETDAATRRNSPNSGNGGR